MAEFDMSQATIVSMLPYTLTEVKPGLNPNEFIIQGKGKDEFGLTIIPDNVYYLINPDLLSDAKEVRQIPVPVKAMELAQSIISDYVGALLGVDLPEIMPGIFAVKGNYTDKKLFKTKFANELQHYTECQNRWFIRLVEVADDTWAKSRSPVGISDLQRHAVRSLQYEREWLNPLPGEQLDKCPVCKTIINAGAVKCVACGYILNKIEYDKVMAATK